MKERDVRKKALEVLTGEDYISWYPSPVRWKKEIDIFGVFDLICCRKSSIKFIQLTSFPNIRAREKKILAFLKPNKIKLNSEVWGYNQKKRKFKIVKVSP